MKNTGFTLVELTVYVALFSFVAVLFLGVASRAQFKFMRASSSQEHLLRQSLAIDLLRRDLMSASFFAFDWDVQASTQNVVFKKMILRLKSKREVNAVCWFIGTKGLMKAYGKYSFAKHEWENRTACLVCESINKIDFALQKSEDGTFVGAWITYKSTGPVTEKKFFVKFRNRVVV